MRFTRVRNSLAEYTPLKCSPGMFRKRGSPAPVAMKTASKPSWSMSSSIVTVLPTTTLVSRDHAAATQDIDFVMNNLFWKTELGNAVDQHSPELVECLEDVDLMAHLD